MRAFLLAGGLAALLAAHAGAAAGPSDGRAGASIESQSKQLIVQDRQSPAEEPALAPGLEVQPGLHTVLGIEVHTPTDRNIGRVIDVLADRDGKIQAAVIEFGGFMGLGTRKVAVEWAALRFQSTGKAPIATAEITRDQLRLAPENKPGEPVVVLKALRTEPSADTP